MVVKKFTDCEEFIAGDGTILRELLHPDKEPLELRYSLAHAKLKVGETSYLHTLSVSEVYYILRGKGLMEVNAERAEVGPGDTIYIPPGAKQRITSLGPEELEFLCIVDPAWKAADERVLGGDGG
ncbi:cupin domain-containing protein [bacterium]|nr:cupin domain-containing protein [bacterium]